MLLSLKASPLSVALAAFLVLGSAARAASEAEWIWHAGARDGGNHGDGGNGSTVFLRKEFHIDGEVSKAEITALAEFNRSTVFVNGRRILDAADGGYAPDDHVHRWLQNGANVIAVRAVRVRGPAAIALCLKITLTDGTRQSVATDGSWHAAGNAEDGWQEPAFAPGVEWANAASFGRVEPELWNNPQAGTAINEIDDYSQWKQALGAERETDPATFLVPAGFQIERLRSAQPDEGSWVSLEFDPQGRLIVAREDKGLLRMTLNGADVARVETINHTLEECRGLLSAHGALYVNANNSKGLYRLRDTDGDDRYDEVKLLYKSEGGVGHGRNDLALGPDGLVYAIHGDAVDLPVGFADRTSPIRRQGKTDGPREGHLLRFDADGRNGELIATGLRNPYGIDFSPVGEAFTYDADAEYDMGAPWYRPTRIAHLASGADFGWRSVTGRWPPYYPDHADNAPPVLDIGKGSPTGVKFGTKSRFPPRYQRALYVLDWAYGRIVAVHLTPHGAGYVARAETFLKGRPLNVTDLDFGPDGELYFVTGGRKTQAALYRVRYTGPAVAEEPSTAQQSARFVHAVRTRALRHRLESFHGRPNPEALDVAWDHLDSEDRWIRHAARIAVEHQPLEAWQERAFTESRPLAAATAVMALARSGREELRPRIVQRLNALPLADVSPATLEAVLYTYRLCLAEPERIDRALRDEIVRALSPLFPHKSLAANEDLSRLLVLLEAPGAVGRVLDLLAATTNQPERMHYLFILRNAKAGWTPEDRRNYFLSLGQMRQFQGGEGLPAFMRHLEADALAALSEAERTELAPLLAGNTAADLPASEPRPFIREWQWDELVAALPEGARGRNLERGKDLFVAALCVHCHRVGHLGSAIGPDLTAIGSRFSRRDILKSILAPSEVVAEQYRRTQIVTTTGRVLIGQIVPGRDYRSPTLGLLTDPLKPDSLVEIPKSEIERHISSPTSVMPAGLLNTLTKDEILDLLAWLEAGGDPRRVIPQPP